MENETRIYTDRFLGEITLTKIGETLSPKDGGERIGRIIYTDINGNIWIDTWMTTGYMGERPLKCIDKEIIDIILNNNR